MLFRKKKGVHHCECLCRQRRALKCYLPQGTACGREEAPFPRRESSCDLRETLHG